MLTVTGCHCSWFTWVLHDSLCAVFWLSSIQTFGNTEEAMGPDVWLPSAMVDHSQHMSIDPVEALLDTVGCEHWTQLVRAKRIGDDVFRPTESGKVECSSLYFSYNKNLPYVSSLYFSYHNKSTINEHAMPI